jgi:hypothetical protein
MATHRWVAILPAIAAVACVPANAGEAGILERPYDLELRIDGRRQDIRLGDEILITFTIANNDPALFPYTDRTDDRSGRMYEYELTAKYLDGRPVPDPREREMPTIGGGLSNAPGQLEKGGSFQKTIALNLWAYERFAICCVTATRTCGKEQGITWNWLTGSILAGRSGRMTFPLSISRPLTSLSIGPWKDC